MLLPFRRMDERVDLARDDSDAAYFHDLLSYAEMVMKFSIAGLVATVKDDRSRSRYRQAYRLVRASGIGEWDEVAEELLFGTASQYVVAEARDIQKDFTQKLADDSWQWQCVSALRNSLVCLGDDVTPVASKTNSRQWFKLFARLRNSAKHGSPTAQAAASICPQLAESIRLLVGNALIFRRDWAYLKRNISGKYRVLSISDTAESFEYLKKAAADHHSDAIYLFLDRPRRVELVESDADLSDFYLANGGFTSSRYEKLSYVTGRKVFGDSGDYQTPADELPLSTTHGFGELDVRGHCLTNSPMVELGYVSRHELEIELMERLRDRELHRIITLLGRGGVGKTSLALHVIDKIAGDNRYDTIIWFSARDIDLLSDGPKPVRQQVFTIREMAREFARLIGEVSIKDDTATRSFTSALSTQELGATLFVFDNFETVENPPAAYQWIDTYLRHPNKALITARHREFKGDYPVEVLGMTEEQSVELVDRQAARLGIAHLMSQGYKEELFRESDGHPYVIKILLGDVARLGRQVTVERIISDRDDLLTALFERTYAKLSPIAQRVFLTLSGWRSSIPIVALQAALLRSSDERVDVNDAIDELARYSFVETIKSEADDTYFVVTPLAAAAFGKRKLPTAPSKAAIEVDLKFLQLLGPGQREDVKRGLGPRIERMLRSLADKDGLPGRDSPEEMRVLQFLADKHPPVWLWLSERFEVAGDLQHSKDYVRKYLEAGGLQQITAWERLAELCRRTEDIVGQVHALVGMSEIESADVRVISRATNKVNALFRDKSLPLDSDEKRLLIQKLVHLFETKLSRADATDISRLAWLKLNIQDDDGARAQVRSGLLLDPRNEHLRNLAAKLGVAVS